MPEDPAADLAYRLAVGRAHEPADLVLKGRARALGLHRELLEADVAIGGKHVARVARGYNGLETADARGLILLPGFIDGHMHIESTKLMVDEFARAALPWRFHGVPRRSSGPARDRERLRPGWHGRCSSTPGTCRSIAT